MVSETLTLSDSATGARTGATEVDKVESVFTQEPQATALSVQPRESAIIAGQSNRKLEVKRDCCRWEETALRVWSAVRTQVLLYSQELRWRVWMDSGGCWLH